MMSNVDRIIKYLSGEMEPGQGDNFRKEVESDPVLKEEFVEVSAAFDLIRDQLQRQDDNEFRARLREVMEKNVITRQQRGKNRMHWRYFLLPLAGALALLIVLILQENVRERVFSKFYHPENDAVVLALNQGTRGTAGRGIHCFTEGDYPCCMQEMDRILQEDPGNQQALLYYLLASIETGRQEEALLKYREVKVEVGLQPGQSIIWYASLAMVKSGQPEEAADELGRLLEVRGPYRSGALRMKKMLLK